MVYIVTGNTGETCDIISYIDLLLHTISYVLSDMEYRGTGKQEASARQRALCQLTEYFGFVKVIMRGKHNYQGKGCTEIQQMVTEQHVLTKFRS